MNQIEDLLLTVVYTLINFLACAIFYYLGYMKGCVVGSRETLSEVRRFVRRELDESDHSGTEDGGG